MLNNYEIAESDILVIGGGLAGMIASMKAKDLGAKTILAIKGKLSSGTTGLNKALCINKYIDSRDKKEDAYFKDCIKAGSGMCDEKLVRIMVDSKRRTELKKWGFNIKESKPIDRKTCWATYPRGAFYPNGIKHLREIVLRKGIEIYEHVMITELLKLNGFVAGAIGIDRNGKIIIFKSKSTIIATGGPHQVYQYGYNLPNLTGDGHMLAYRVGAELINLEFPQLCIGTFPESRFPLVCFFWRNLHKIRNDKGELFLEKNLSGENTIEEVYEIRSHQCDFTSETEGRYIDISIYKEIMKGRKVFVECELVNLLGHKDIELMTYVHSFLGGIKINERAETNIPGLYAAGEVVGNIHGTNRPGGNMHKAGIEFGCRAAEYGVEYARDNDITDLADLDLVQIGREQKRILEILTNKPKINITDVKNKIQEIMYSNVMNVRTEKGLKNCINKLEKIKKSINRNLSSIRENLFKVLSLLNLLDIGILISNAALMRCESRGGHYREDFKNIDNVKWNKPIILKKNKE